MHFLFKHTSPNQHIFGVLDDHSHGTPEGTIRLFGFPTYMLGISCVRYHKMSIETQTKTPQTQQATAKQHLCAILPFVLAEKMVDKPLKIRGLAMTVGISRNFNIYTPQELEAFAAKLQNAPVYIEHVTAQSAVGKVTAISWDGQSLFYEAEIYDDETAQKIRRGLIQHVSVGADYETLDLVNGKIPHGLFNAEMSLVAVPGIAQTNIQILEKLDATTPVNLAESLIKKPSEPTIPISQAIRLIQEVLPSPLVQRSWTLGPQRLCQELRRILLELHRLQSNPTAEGK